MMSRLTGETVRYGWKKNRIEIKKSMERTTRWTEKGTPGEGEEVRATKSRPSAETERAVRKAIESGRGRRFGRRWGATTPVGRRFAPSRRPAFCLASFAWRAPPLRHLAARWVAPPLSDEGASLSRFFERDDRHNFVESSEIYRAAIQQIASLHVSTVVDRLQFGTGSSRRVGSRS